MWEGARPERLQSLKNDRRQRRKESIVAWAIILGVTAVMLKAGLLRWSPPSNAQSGTLPPRETPTERVAPATSSPETKPLTTTPPPTNLARPPAPQSPSTRASRGDPAVMRTLTDTCVYWTRENTEGQYVARQTTACQQMLAYAEQHGFRAPQVTIRTPAKGGTSSSRRSTSTAQVYVNQCDSYGYGSIAYRRCRADEKARLSSECQQLRSRLEDLRGESRHDLMAKMSATCSAATGYQIVK